MNAIRKLVFSAILLAISAAPGLAQSLPPWPITTYGYVATPAQWGQAFTGKQDYLGSAPCLVTGCIFTGGVTLAPSTTINAGLNIAPGVAPTSPNNGDTWVTAAGLFIRINGVTVGPLVGPGGGVLTAGSTATSGYTSGQILGSTGSVLSVYSVSGTGNVALTTSPVFTTPSLGVATGTSLALGGCTIGSNLFCSAGTGVFAVGGVQSLVVGPNGQTNPAFNVDASTASQVAGLNIKGAVTGGTVAISAIDSGSNTNLSIDAKGTGTIVLGGVSTGAITLTRATTLSAALTYGGVTLSNSVTGTGSMVLSNTPSLSNPILASTTPTAAAALGFGSNTINFGDGSVNHSVVSLDQTQTLTNKTLTSPALSGTVTGNFTMSGNIVHSGQNTFTGTSAPSSAAGQSVVMGTIAAPTLSANGQAWLYDTTVNGAVVQGQGSTYDAALADNAGAVALGVSTGTQNLVALGGITAASLSTSGTVAGSLCATSGGLFVYKVGINCEGAGTATNIAPGTTTVSPNTANGPLANTGGTVSQATWGQLPGIASNTAASAGNVGEYISSSIAQGSAVALTTAVSANITSVSLTAGDWDCRGNSWFVPGGTATLIENWISTTSATAPTRPNGGSDVNTGTISSTNQNGLSIPPSQFLLNSTTTVFLGINASFTVSGSAYGFIGCRRMR